MSIQSCALVCILHFQFFPCNLVHIWNQLIWYTHWRCSRPPDHCHRRASLGESCYDYVTVLTNLFSILSVKKKTCLTLGLNNWIIPFRNATEWLKSIIINFYRKSILIEVTTLFPYRFLSIDMENWYSWMIDIDYNRLLSIIGISINYSWFIKSKMCMRAEILHSVATTEDNGRFQPRPRRVILG